MPIFPAEMESIRARILAVDPVSYAKTRNYVDGGVSYLSPYISRGVISTSHVLKVLSQEKKIEWTSMYKFIQELAWRDYFQQVWKELVDLNRDIKQKQAGVSHDKTPLAIINASTGILSIDQAIGEFYQTGYLHNHLRMYIASIATNIGRSYWIQPAKWMYYHLLDADWGSNALSWQWVAGAFSHKKYYANQSNINKFTFSGQHGSYLDRPYEELLEINIPDELTETIDLKLKTVLPDRKDIFLDPSIPLLIYNFYNLDPNWRADIKANRVLLLEPSFFKTYPSSEKSIKFVLELADQISDLQVFTGEFDDLKERYNGSKIYYKEHPTVLHYQGNEDEREWMFPTIEGYFSSFSKFWRKCEKILKDRGSGNLQPTLF